MNFLEAVEIASKSSFGDSNDYLMCTIRCNRGYCNVIGDDIDNIDNIDAAVDSLLSNDWCIEFEECDWTNAVKILDRGGKISYGEGYMHFVDDELVDQDGDPVHIKKDFSSRRWVACC